MAEKNNADRKWPKIILQTGHGRKACITAQTQRSMLVFCAFVLVFLFLHLLAKRLFSNPSGLGIPITSETNSILSCLPQQQQEQFDLFLAYLVSHENSKPRFTFLHTLWTARPFQSTFGLPQHAVSRNHTTHFLRISSLFLWTSGYCYCSFPLRIPPKGSGLTDWCLICIARSTWYKLHRVWSTWYKLHRVWVSRCIQGVLQVWVWRKY